MARLAKLERSSSPSSPAPTISRRAHSTARHPRARVGRRSPRARDQTAGATIWPDALPNSIREPSGPGRRPGQRDRRRRRRGEARAPAARQRDRVPPAVGYLQERAHLVPAEAGHGARAVQVTGAQCGAVHGQVRELLGAGPVHGGEPRPRHGAWPLTLTVEADVQPPRRAVPQVGQGLGVLGRGRHRGRCSSASQRHHPRRDSGGEGLARGTAPAAGTRTPGCPGRSSRSAARRRTRARRTRRRARAAGADPAPTTKPISASKSSRRVGDSRAARDRAASWPRGRGTGVPLTATTVPAPAVVADRHLPPVGGQLRIARAAAPARRWSHARGRNRSRRSPPPRTEGARSPRRWARARRSGRCGPLPAAVPGCAARPAARGS